MSTAYTSSIFQCLQSTLSSSEFQHSPGWCRSNLSEEQKSRSVDLLILPLVEVADLVLAPGPNVPRGTLIVQRAVHN